MGTFKATGHAPRRGAFYATVAVFLAVMVSLNWAEHRAHILGAVPYVLLGLCVGMHFFMHRSHGHGDHESSDHPKGKREVGDRFGAAKGRHP